ncbi:CsbD family protein [Corynebacterium caspium]|uniref:CsbD family protein n=1 Tax=Corynebacterium caspium TaxID=234828 RepID=UPI00035E9A73|nr:CsbD family protein [Corynebacterium caspium]WKD58529.1 CsbD-like protein [Corynebacterium caspium DSM 44850]
MGDLSNKADDLMGKAKEAAGNVVDDKDLQNEGKAEQLIADVKEGLSDAADAVKDKANEVLGKLQDKADEAK